MKYLADPMLEALSRTLSHSSAECTVHTRIEAYSCKPIGKDKKLWKQIDEHFADEAPELLDSPFGALDTAAARRMFCLLIATLNVVYGPDHEFSEVSPDHFQKENDAGASVLSALSTTLSNLRVGEGAHSLSSRTYGSFPTQSGNEDFFPSQSPPSSSPTRSLSGLLADKASPTSPVVANIHPTLYRILNDVVTLSECEVFSYTPDIYSDPHGGGYSDDEDSDSDDEEDEAYDSDRYSDDESNEYWDDGSNSFGSNSYTSRRSGGVAPWDVSSFDDDDAIEPPTITHRRSRRGALLWSNHYFFFHKKEKKIIFITSWSRRRPTVSITSTYDDESEWVVGSASKDRDSFAGWEGAVGAGARAFNIATRKNGLRG